MSEDGTQSPSNGSGADPTSDPSSSPSPEPDPSPDPSPNPTPDPSPSPSPSPNPDPDPSPIFRRRRVRVLVGVGAIVASLVLYLIVHARRHPPIAVALPSDGRAAIHAPIGPHLPNTPHDGVKLTGFVVDGAGLPVIGAEVSAELERGAADRALAAKPGSDAGVARDAGTPDASPGAVEIQTGADGHFILESLQPGRYRIHVTGTGLLAAEVRFVPVPSDEARIVVARQVSIAGTVTDGGKPVAAATVGIRGDAIGGAIEIKTDARGAFEVPNLPEGRYQVFAWRAELAARAVRVSRLGSGPFGPVELRLEAATIVVGTVIDRTEGTGVVAEIELRPSGDDQAPRYARSGQDGVFRIEGVPNGRWIADAFAPGYTSPGGVELDAGKGRPELVLQRGAAIEGRVLDGDGRPVAGATVRALTAGTNPTEYSAEVDLDRLRRFAGRTAAPPREASGSDPELIPRGELGVMVGPIPPLPPPGAQIARPAAVVDPGVASAGLVGDPPPLPSDPGSASIWTTGSDGKYRIRGVGKGRVTVLGLAAGYAEARSRPVAIAAGEVVQNVDLVLTAGTFLVGKVTDQHGAPVIGAELSAHPDVGAPVDGFSDGDGLYRIGPVAGTIELRATAYGHVDVRRTLEVAATKTSAPAERKEDLVLDVADATLAGTLADSSGLPIAAAQLEVIAGSGEGRHVVVGADGTFSIDMLPRGHLRVRVQHPDYPTDELDAVASATGERAHLVLPLGGAVEGVLLDAASGAPLVGMTITASGAAGTEAATDKTGRWRLGPLKPGHWKIEVKLPGYLPLVRELDVPAAGRPGTASVRDVRIEVARGALVGGTVRDKRGQRVGGAHVIVKSAIAQAEGDTDAQGEFRIHDAPTGDIVVTASRGEDSGSTHATVRAGDEVLGLAVELR